MTRFLNVVVMTVAVLVMAPLAHAEPVLVTSPLARRGVVFNCMIANADTREVIVRVEALDSTGNIDLGPSEVSLDPGALVALGLPSTEGSAFLYCRFTMVKGSKGKVRANACALSSVDNSGPCLSVAEAR
jgi:hypothetical protein